MAHTIAEIYNRIIQEKEQQEALNALLPAGDNYENYLSDLDTKSKVSIWRLWVYLIAVVQHIQETFWDLFKTEVKQVLSSGNWGSVQWWMDRAYGYQEGDPVTIVLVNGIYTPGYNVVDPEKQVIKKAAMRGGTLKVATTNSEGKLVGLSPARLNLFRYYVDQVMIPNAPIDVISQDADSLRLGADVLYDPLMDSAVIKAAVIAAIEDYLRNLPFVTGIIDRNDIIARIRQVDGVRNAYITTFMAKASNSTMFAPVERMYPTFAGYIEVSADHPLTDTINLITE